MHFSTLFAVALFLDTTLSHTINCNGGKATTRTTRSCSVQYVKKSVKYVPTRRSTITQNLPAVTVTSPTRSTVKVTPQPKTVTLTKYAVTKTTTTLKIVMKGYSETDTETAISTRKC